MVKIIPLAPTHTEQRSSEIQKQAAPETSIHCRQSLSVQPQTRQRRLLVLLIKGVFLAFIGFHRFLSLLNPQLSNGRGQIIVLNPECLAI